MFLKSLDHFISIFRFNSSAWFLYDGLASRNTKIIERPAHNGKLGFLVFISKQMGSKDPHPAKAFGTGMSSMDIEANFRKSFLGKYIDKVVNVVKSTRSRKAPRYIYDEALDTEYFDQCTEFSV